LLSKLKRQTIIMTLVSLSTNVHQISERIIYTQRDEERTAPSCTQKSEHILSSERKYGVC
jgi:hypothetical protein